MARKTKCTCCHCKKEGYNIDFISIPMNNGMNVYVCSEECERELSDDDRLKLNIKYWFITCTKKNMTKNLSTYYSKWVNEFDIDDLKVIESILFNQWREITSFMEYKEFKYGTQAFKYLMTILENKLEEEKNLRNKVKAFEFFNVDFAPQEDVKTVIKHKKDISKWL